MVAFVNFRFGMGCEFLPAFFTITILNFSHSSSSTNFRVSSECSSPSVSIRFSISLAVAARHVHFPSFLYLQYNFILLSRQHTRTPSFSCPVSGKTRQRPSRSTFHLSCISNKVSFYHRQVHFFPANITDIATKPIAGCVAVFTGLASHFFAEFKHGSLHGTTKGS